MMERLGRTTISPSPLTPRELLACINALLRRQGAEVDEEARERLSGNVLAMDRHMRTLLEQMLELAKGDHQQGQSAHTALDFGELVSGEVLGYEAVFFRQLGRTHTVIFSSHILSEVQAICDRILIIAHGELIAFDRPENLERQLLTQNEITFTTQVGPEEVEAVLAGLEPLSEITHQQKAGGYTQTHCKTTHPEPYEMTRQMFWAFAERDIPLLELTLKKASLEDEFLELTEDREEPQPEEEPEEDEMQEVDEA